MVYMNSILASHTTLKCNLKTTKMEHSSPADNCARFDVMLRASQQCDHINDQLVTIEQLGADISKQHLKTLIDEAQHIATNLQHDWSRGQRYQELRKSLPHLEPITSIPLKLGQYVDDINHFEDALYLLEAANDLNRRYSREVPIIDSIYKQSKRYHEILIVNLCNRLDQLEESSQSELKTLVNQLVRCGNLSNRDLRLRFLQARDFWFNNECEKKSESFDELISFFCQGLPKIFEEYKYIFGESSSLANSKLIQLSISDDTGKEDGAIINSWLLLKTSTFILSLELHLKNLEQSRSLTPSILSDTMQKCFKLTDWLASIGFDFSSQLRPIFNCAVIAEIKYNVQQATERFETSFTHLISKSIESLLLPVEDEILRISNIRPEEVVPKSLEHYPIFKIYCLYMIEALRWAHATKTMISPMGLCLDVYATLNGSLTRVMKALSVVLNMDNNSNHPILSKIAISFLTEALPFIANYCELLFPEKVILGTIGISKTEFKSLCANDPEKVRNFRLDLRQIGQPIRGTMPALMQAIEG